jgi:hypothetical protein
MLREAGGLHPPRLGRERAGRVRQVWDYLEDTTDPLYWERDSIKPFWF